MDRIITAAWRAFWIGLGASVVILGQSVLDPHPPAAVPSSPAVVAPAPHGPAISDKRVYDHARRAMARRRAS